MSPGMERGRGANASGLNDYGHHATSPPKTTPSVEEQADLFADYARQLAETARDAGVENAASNDAEFVDRALVWIEELIAGTEVSADAVRREFGSSPAMGSVFRSAHRGGLIEFVGYRTSTAPSRHRGDQKSWRRLP